MTSRESTSRIGHIASLAALVLAATASLGVISATSANAAPASPTGFGVFYVNGVQRVSNWSDNRTGPFPTKGLTTTYNQARITYLVPENPTGGYPVYIVSPPDRGESMPVDQTCVPSSSSDAYVPTSTP
jgi:hypothetical protein